MTKIIVCPGTENASFHCNPSITRPSFQILRIQSPKGTKRLEICENACLRDLFESVHSLFDLDSFDFALFKERNNKDEVTQPFLA